MRLATVTWVRTRIAPSRPSPTPSLPTGPLSRFILHPQRLLHELEHGAVRFLAHLAPYLIAACVIVVAIAVQRHLRTRTRADRTPGRRISILPPPEIDAEAAQLVWMGLHALLRPWWRRMLIGQPHLAWEITARGDDVDVGVWVPDDVPVAVVERALKVAFPGAQTRVGGADPLAEVFDQRPVEPNHHKPAREYCELGLAERAWFPIGEGTSETPLGLVLASLSGLGEDEAATIQILAQPATSAARYRLRRAARVLRAGGSPGVGSWRVARGRRGAGRPAPDPSLEGDVRGILAKASSPLWDCVVRVAVSAPDREQARGLIHGLAGAFAVFEGRNGLRRRRRAPGGLARMCARRIHRPYLLSVPELARLATLPSAGAIVGLERAGARTVPPPRALPRDAKILGIADHPASRSRPVSIAVPDARHHIHIVGETGTGKSTLLARMVLSDAQAGRAAVVIDPKGDLIETILQRLPEGAEERTCVIDPQDPSHAVGLNVLAGEDRDLVVDHVIGVFRRIYEQWWGPRTDDIMRAACLTLAQIPGATLAEVPLLLANFEWRRAIRERIADAVGLGAFWAWYDKLPEQQRTQHIAPLLNKLRAFLLRGPVRAIVGQAKPKRDIDSLIDSGGLILVRVPKGTLGEDTSRILGALVITRIWQAAMRRAAMPEEQRPDCTLYVDEMHNYLALPRSFEDLLAEARGYRLSLVLAHQHMGQLPKDMREALGANARTKIVFTCSPEDASHLETHFAPDLSDYDLSHLQAYQAACRPCIAGGQGQSFTFRTEALGPGDPARAEEVKAKSAQVYGADRKTVDSQIASRQMSAATGLLPPMVSGPSAKQSRGESRGGSRGESPGGTTLAGGQGTKQAGEQP